MRSKYIVMVILLAVIAFSGCATGVIGVMPEIKDNNYTSNIIIIRPYNFVALSSSAYISFDNNNILAIRAAEYIKFLAPSGDHTIGADYEKINIVLTPKNKYYFRITVGFPSFHIAPMTEDEAKPYLTEEAYLPYDNTNVYKHNIKGL